MLQVKHTFFFSSSLIICELSIIILGRIPGSVNDAQKKKIKESKININFEVIPINRIIKLLISKSLN